MWQSTYATVVPGLDRLAVWRAWADVNRWHHWDRDIDSAELYGEFEPGAEITLRPKGGSAVRLQLVRAEPLAGYTDLARFPLARMYGIHDMRETAGGLALTITIRVEGPLAWLWRRLVAQNVADEAPAQIAALAAFVHSDARADASADARARAPTS